MRIYTGTPFISVIIPAFNNQAQLDKCLHALAKQDYATDLFEVIVVDNGSNPPLTIDDTCCSRIFLTQCDTLGSYAARNAGLKSAIGEVVAFTDSDCIPRTDWLCRVSEVIAGRRVTIIGGEVELFPANIDSPTLIELYDIMFGLRQAKYVLEHGFAVTANLVVRRSVFETVGLFNERLYSGGDREWSHRALHAGYRIIYSRDVIVTHPCRRDLKSILKKMRRVAGGGAQSVKENITPQYQALGFRKPASLKDKMQGITAIFTNKKLSILDGLGVLAIALVVGLWNSYHKLLFRVWRKPPRE